MPKKDVVPKAKKGQIRVNKVKGPAHIETIECAGGLQVNDFEGGGNLKVDSLICTSGTQVNTFRAKKTTTIGEVRVQGSGKASFTF